MENREVDTVESVHAHLVAVELPASVENIKNPAEDFIVHIISEFFRSFHIDVATIKRLTQNQMNALEVTNAENAPIAPTINLSEAVASIGQQIFIKDFHITDITSPGERRTKKHLKFIANFMLYAQNKKNYMQERIDEVLSRAEKIGNLRKQHQEIMERMNKQALVTAQKKVEIERIQQEITDREAKISQNKLRIANEGKILKEKEEIKSQKIARNQAKRAELQKRQEITDELNAKIVRSPEKFKAQLKDLTEARKNQEEKRENMQGAILQKKKLLQNYDAALTFIKKEQTKLKEVIEDQKKLKVTKKESERLKGEIEEAVRTISLNENLGSQEEHQVIAGAIQECEKTCQERIQKIRKTYMEMDSEKKLLERKKENLETRCTELYSETTKLRGKITEVEGDISKFLKETQELRDSEIAKIQKLHNTALAEME